MKRLSSFRTLSLASLLALTLPMSNPAKAQRDPNGAASKPPTITVLGTGETQSKPDVAYVTVGAMSNGKNAQETSAANANLTQQIVAELKKAGIAEKDIQTSGYSIQPLYKNNDYAAGIQGYQVSNTVRATVRKMSAIGAVIDATIKAGANNIQGVGFGLEKHDAADDAALQDAVTNARRKADVIARAAGLRIVGIREISAAPYEPRPMPMMEFSRAKVAAATPVEPGELTVTAQVTAVYEVAPAERRASRTGAK